MSGPSLPPAPQWRPLPSFPGLPQLYISPLFRSPALTHSVSSSSSSSSSSPSSSSSYTIHVTDLASVWTEALDKKGILRRSLTEDTSIDLLDAGPEQWDVFMSKLSAAFDEKSADHAGTGLSIESAAAAAAAGSVSKIVTTTSGGGGLGERGGDLVLKITCILPEPLEPLSWPVCLKKCTPSAAAGILTVPLLVAQRGLRGDVDDLVAILGEKDAVITRLVDKLEAMGAGLENVFHALPGKRRTTRAVAEEKVKGLRVFREAEWRAERRDERRIGGDGHEGQTGDGVVALVNDCFRESGQDGGLLDRGLGLPDDLNDWWSRLGSEPVEAAKPRANTVASSDGEGNSEDKHGPSKRHNIVDDDDDFQVQNTPPHLQQPTQAKKSTRGGETGKTTINTDDDDSDEDVSIPDSHPPVHQTKGSSQGVTAQSASQSSRTVPAHDDDTASDSDAPAAKPARSLPARKGKSGRPAQARSPSPQPETAEVEPAVLGKDYDNEDTATGSDSDVSMSEAKPKATAVPLIRQLKTGGLGKIGCVRNKAPARAQSPPSAQDNDNDIDDDSVLETEAPATSTRFHETKPTSTASATNNDDSDNTASSRENSHSPAKSPKPPSRTSAEVRAPRRKIGTIAGRRYSTAAAAGEHHDDEDGGDSKKRSRPDSAASTSTGIHTRASRDGIAAAAAAAGGTTHQEEEEENDEKRAERKRAELAKELERKAAAPVKKKRRF